MIYYLNSLPSTSPSDKKYIANFDFTQSTIDSVNGMVANLYNCSRDSLGVHLTAANSNIRITQLVGIMNTPIFTIEVKFGDCNAVSSSSNKRLIMWSYDSGFIYRSNGHWYVYNASNWQDEGSSDINEFANATLKMKFYLDHKIEVYKNDTLFYSDSNIGDLSSPVGLLIGSTSNSFFDIYVKSVKVYYD